MALPPVSLPREDVILTGGQVVSVRGLSRAEVLRMQGLGDAVELHLVAVGTDTPLEDAASWYEGAPSKDAEDIAAAVMRLSAMGAAEGNGSSGA